ncbi:MAG: hypothetical protein ACI8W7_000322 [Gammaproteobacteria bacterium]|jgi:hypothetical protein
MAIGKGWHYVSVTGLAVDLCGSTTSADSGLHAREWGRLSRALIVGLQRVHCERSRVDVDSGYSKNTPFPIFMIVEQLISGHRLIQGELVVEQFVDVDSTFEDELRALCLSGLAESPGAEDPDLLVNQRADRDGDLAVHSHHACRAPLAQAVHGLRSGCRIRAAFDALVRVASASQFANRLADTNSCRVQRHHTTPQGSWPAMRS